MSAIQNPMLKCELDPRADAVYKVIRGRINWDNLVPICIEAVGELQQFTELKGVQKLELLQAVLKHALRESNKSIVEKEQILHYIDTVVPIVTQAAVLAVKSGILRQVATSCWKKCMF